MIQRFWRGSQVVRQGSAKALCVGSIPTSASNSIDAELSGFTLIQPDVQWHIGRSRHINVLRIEAIG